MSPLPFWSSLKNLIQTLERSKIAYKTAEKTAHKPVWYSSHFEGVLGTSLELKIQTSHPTVAAEAQKLLLAEISRLERIFSRFIPDSELCVWLQTNQEVQVSLELAEVLRRSLEWQRISAWVFHPATDALSVLWRQAEQTGREPDPLELEAVLSLLRPIPYTLKLQDGKYFARLLTAVSLNFNAIAKGYIVDLAGKVAQSVAGVSEVLVNIGGDLRHMSNLENLGNLEKLGRHSVNISIADPRSSAQNIPPIAQIQIHNQAVASSGHHLRGFRVGETWYSHLLDPRTGRPVPAKISASVIADDSATADVLATIFSILPPNQSLEIANQLPRVGCLLVSHADSHSDADSDSSSTRSAKFCNAFWKQHASKTPLGETP